MKAQKEVMKEFNKKCLKLTIKVFIHKISNKITMSITIIFYIKTQVVVVVEEIMFCQFRTFINVKITPNKLMLKKCNKSKKVSTIKIKLFKIISSMMKLSLGKKASPYQTSKICKRLKNLIMLKEVESNNQLKNKSNLTILIWCLLNSGNRLYKLFKKGKKNKQ